MTKRLNLNRIISANIAYEMRLRKMSVKEFTKRIGIGEASYHNKMQGRTAWTDENLDRICRVLDTSAAILVTRREAV